MRNLLTSLKKSVTLQPLRMNISLIHPYRCKYLKSLPHPQQQNMPLIAKRINLKVNAFNIIRKYNHKERIGIFDSNLILNTKFRSQNNLELEVGACGLVFI